MQTSNLPEATQAEKTDLIAQTAPKDPHWQQFTYALVTLLFFALLSIWIMQNSVNAYFQQTYHQPSPLAPLDDYPAWKTGASISQRLYQQHDQIKNSITAFNATQIENFNQGYAYTPEYKRELAKKRQIEQQRLALEAKVRAQEAKARAQEDLLNQFHLNKGEQVFFAGDSLMQGVAPYEQKFLLENYEIKSVNLSTGKTTPTSS